MPPLRPHRLPRLGAILAVFLGGPDALQRLHAAADVPVLGARVVAVGEAAVLGVLAAVDDEFEVAHCPSMGWWGVGGLGGG